MTQEEKAKAYDNALEKAKKELQSCGTQDCDTARQIFRFFPELKENEDELIWLTKYIEEEAYSLSMDIRDNEDRIKLKKLQRALAWLKKQNKIISWKPSKEEMDVLYGLAYITNQYDEHKEEVITCLYQDLKREFFNGSSYENMFPNIEDDVRRRNTIQVLEYARSLDTYNQYGKADIDKNIAWLEKQGKQKEYTFKSIPRLLDMIEPTERAKAYCQKLIDTLKQEGYDTDAKIVEECLKQMNGEHVAMAVMDEKQSDNLVENGYTNNKDIIKYADDYSHAIWHKLMDNFKNIEDYHIGCNDVSDIVLNTIIDAYNWIEEQGEKPQGKTALEAINEEKVDNANKIEPKFKVGNWVVQGCNILKIRCVGDKYYCFETVGGYADDMLVSEIDSLYHLWSIQDAKDGDVLFHSDSASNGIFIFKELLKCGFSVKVVCYCDYDSDDGFCLGEHHTCCWADAKILHPATKEQRNLLFQKMHEAGYEWDADKKELMKIVAPIFNIGDTIAKKHNSDINKFGQFTITDITGGTYWYNDRIICDITEQDEWELYEPVRQKPTWSEEDESCINDLLEFFGKGNCLAHEVNDIIYWLKSIKERMK